MQTVKEAFWSSRPLSWINTAAPFAAGYVIASGRIDALAVIGFLYFLIPYNVMLYGVNDVFDYESDVNNPRKRSLEGAVIARARHRRLLIAAVVTNLPFIILGLLAGSSMARIVFAITIFFNLAYSLKGLRFKEKAFLDSFTSSMHFVLPLVYGWLLAGSNALPWAAVVAFVFWGMASHAFGAVQDVVYDREAGIGSVATIIGARTTIRFAAAGYLVAAVVIGLSYGVYGWAAAPALLLYALNVWVYRDADDATAGRTNLGWKQFLWLNLACGFWLTQILLAAYNPFGLTDGTRLTVAVVLVAVGLTGGALCLKRILAQRSRFLAG